MKKLLVIVPCLVLVACCCWLLGASKPEAHDLLVAAPPTVESAEPLARAPLPGTVRSAEPAAANPVASLVAQKLDPKSDALRVRVDENIPSHLYAEAARCYQGGSSRDERIDLTYHLHVGDSEISISNVHVDESTISDRNLERCIRDRISSAHWRDELLPDWDSDDETVYISVRGFKKFLASKDDDEPAQASSLN